MPKKSKSVDPKTGAFIATFFSIIGFIIALLAWKEDKYVMFYAKQSLVVFIFALAVGIVGSIFSFMPVIGWVISTALNIVVFIFWLISWINALSGKMKYTPIIGEFGKKINL